MAKGFFVIAGLITFTLAGCAAGSSRAAPTAIPGWTRPLCGPGIAVASQWDEKIRSVYSRLWRIVEADTGPRDVAVVVVESPEPLAAGSCTRQADGSAMTTIMLPVSVMRAIAMMRSPPDIVIARILAHELAHVALHHDPRADLLDTVTKEYEADELGVYYYERAGFDCLAWVDGVGRWATWGYAPVANERLAVRAACALAKRGQRPPRRAR